MFSNNLSTNYSFGNFAGSREISSQISPQGTMQLADPLSVCKFPHPTSCVRSVSTPSGVIVVAAGGGYVSAVGATAAGGPTNNGEGGKKPSFLQDATDINEAITTAGEVSSMSLHSLPSTDGALGIVGTVNGYVTVFSVSAEGTGLHPVVTKLADICVSTKCPNIVSGEPIIACTIGFDKLWQQEFFACATPHGVCMLSADDSIQLRQSFTVFESQIVSLIAPHPPSADDGNTVAAAPDAGAAFGNQNNNQTDNSGHITALFVVLDSQAIQPVVRAENAFQQVGTECSYCCAPLVELAATDGASQFYVNDSVLIPPSFKYPVSSFGSRVVMCGAGWWGVGISSNVRGSRNSNIPSPTVTLRPTPVSQKLSLVRSISDEAVAFANGCEVLVGTTVEKLGLKQLRPVHTFGSIVLDICGVPLTGIVSTGNNNQFSSAVPSAIGTGVNPTPRMGVSPVAKNAPAFGAGGSSVGGQQGAFAVAVGSTLNLFV